MDAFKLAYQAEVERIRRLQDRIRMWQAILNGFFIATLLVPAALICYGLYCLYIEWQHPGDSTNPSDSDAPTSQAPPTRSLEERLQACSGRRRMKIIDAELARIRAQIAKVRSGSVVDKEKALAETGRDLEIIRTFTASSYSTSLSFLPSLSDIFGDASPTPSSSSTSAPRPAGLSVGDFLGMLLEAFASDKTSSQADQRGRLESASIATTRTSPRADKKPAEELAPTVVSTVTANTRRR